MKSLAPQIHPRFRVLIGRNIAIGPGKAELLEHIQQSGSISEAAKRMDMSYMRAWTLVKTMERCFREPLVKVARGGARHGGAELTANGKRALELYRKMEADGLKATAETRRRLLRLLVT
jgi:molybdate transport system regulatory protein